MTDVTENRAERSHQQGRHSGLLVLIAVALILGGIWYGIQWTLKGAYLGELSPTQRATPNIGAQP